MHFLEEDEAINRREVQAAPELFVKSWLLENIPQAVESEIHNRCFLQRCVGWNVPVIGSQKRSTGGKGALFPNKGRPGKKPTFVWLFWAPEVFENGSRDLNPNSMKFETQVYFTISQRNVPLPTSPWHVDKQASLTARGPLPGIVCRLGEGR